MVSDRRGSVTKISAGILSRRVKKGKWWHMSDGAAKGNNPTLWEKFLADLDEKLQLGLLDRLRRITAYHFESDILFLEAANPDDDTYLRKGVNFTQLELLAQDSTKVREVRLRSISEA